MSRAPELRDNKRLKKYLLLRKTRCSGCGQRFRKPLWTPGPPDYCSIECMRWSDKTP